MEEREFNIGSGGECVGNFKWISTEINEELKNGGNIGISWVSKRRMWEDDEEEVNWLNEGESLSNGNDEESRENWKSASVNSNEIERKWTKWEKSEISSRQKIEWENWKKIKKKNIKWNGRWKEVVISLTKKNRQWENKIK